METKHKYTFKPKYEDKLIELGVFKQFKRNFEDVISVIDDLNSKTKFADFVESAFYWEATPEGHKFWNNISFQ